MKSVLITGMTGQSPPRYTTKQSAACTTTSGWIVAAERTLTRGVLMQSSGSPGRAEKVGLANRFVSGIPLMSPQSNLERYQRIAWAYDLLDFPFEHRRYRKIRPQMFSGLSGRILDAGVGTGRNFPFYPRSSDVVGIDLSPAMLARAERRRETAAAKVELRQMDVTRLDFPDRSFDAAVATFLFCVLPDELQIAGMRELCRVVKPGGIIRCLEYTRPSGGIRRAMTRLWEPWVNWAYGAGFDRQTERYATEAGMQLFESRFVYDELIKLLGARV